jgi:hypothetical protein
MGFLRRHMRVWTAIWALGQCTTVAAFVPRDCCAAHRSHTDETASPRCDETTPGAQCPMRGRDGPPCPMHPASATETHDHDSHQDAPASDADCVLRGTCNGPLAALAVLLSDHGITPDAVTIAPKLQGGPPLPRPVAVVLATSTAPDPPPPRA